MKAILEFDFNKQFDKEEHHYAINGGKYHSIIWKLKEKLFWELDEGEHSEEVMKVYENVFDMLKEYISDHEVSDDF